MVLTQKLESVSARDHHACGKGVYVHANNIGGLREGALECREIAFLPLPLWNLDPDTGRRSMDHKSPAVCVHWL